MEFYRTGESGLVPVRALSPDETDGLAAALVRGRGGALGGEELLFVTTAAGDGTATALALDAVGGVVVVGAADGEVDSDAVTEALQHASTASTHDYDALAERFDGDLREAHAAFFEREPLPPETFNDDQRLRLVGPAFDGDALELASFLSDRELSVEPVRVDAFGGGDEEFLVRFEPLDGEGTGQAGTEDAAETEPAAVNADGGTAVADDGADGPEPEQWVAGEGAGASAAAETDSDAATADTTASAAMDADPVHTASEDTAAGDADVDDADGADDEVREGAATNSLDLPVLLDAVAEGLADRLTGTFEGDPEDVISVERGSELLVRPDHPAYAGGVLRYRLSADTDGHVDFEVNIYGGSEAEKEQMRAVVRANQAAVEEELGYEVAERYGGFHAGREFTHFDRVAAAEIVDEFDRLVEFFHPRVVRA